MLNKFTVFISTAALAAVTLFVPAQEANAVTLDLNSLPAGQSLDFSASKKKASSTPTALNGYQVYENVATLSGIQIDAKVTTIRLNSASITNFDSIGSASTNDKYFQIDNSVVNAGGSTSFKFEFYDHADGSPLVLKNVAVTSIDLDSPGRQYTEFSGFQNYVFSTNTKLSTYTVDQNSTALTDGLVRFIQTRTVAAASSNNDPFAAVQVNFTELSNYVAVFGNEVAGQGGFFGVSFQGLCATATGSACTAAAAQPNPNNSPPTSSNSSLNYFTGLPVVLSTSNFPFSDPDNNPFSKLQITSLPSSGTLEFFNGSSWVTVTLNQEISASDLSLGYLRYTGTSAASIGFKVNDATIYSLSAYTLSLVPASLSQTITFQNPGNQTPTTPSFASNATADSGLTVNLVSQTPSVCTVSGLNITPVAAGTCTIVASQAGNAPGSGTYGAATNVTQTFFITTQAAQTITMANPGAQTWGGSGFTIAQSPTASSGLSVTLTSLTPSVCTISGTTITIVGPGTCQIRGTQAGGLNGGTTYAPAPPVTISFVIDPSSTPSPTSQTITYAQPSNGNLNDGSRTVTPATDSGLTVTLTSSTPSVCTVSGFVITYVTAGTCTTIASQAGNGTYAAATSVTRSFTIAAASLIAQTITYTQPSNGNLSDANLTVSPTSDSGLTVYLTSTTPSVCTVSGFIITYVSAGTCTTVASQAGNGTYAAATSVTRSFTISAASLTAQTITLPNPGAQNLSSNTVTLNPTATSGLTVVLTSSTPSVCTVSGSIVTFVGPGTCTIVGNQAGNGTYSAAPAVTISFLVTGTSTPTVVPPPATTPTTRFTQPVTPVIPKTSPTVKPSATPATTTSPAAAAPAASTGQRSVGEIASESIGGFKPGAGLRIEVTGSRISGQFVVSPASIADPVALATAIEESTSRTKSNFAQVNSVVPATTAPQSSQIFDTPITTKVSDVFAASGLDKPRTVGDLKPSTKQKWLTVDASVTSYVPGSTVYLVVTTQPTILAAATVGKDGKATLDGLLPVDLLDAGGHNIRLVGTRLIDGVSADNAGKITLDDSAITEIKKFDEGTKATVALYGKSSAGSSMSAVREVYLDKVVAWWTVWLAAGIALLALLLRFLRGPARFGRRLTTGILAFAGGLPAFIIGWTSASYELWIGTGIGLAVAAIVLFWGRVGNKLNRMND